MAGSSDLQSSTRWGALGACGLACAVALCAFLALSARSTVGALAGRTELSAQQVDDAVAGASSQLLLVVLLLLAVAAAFISAALILGRRISGALQQLDRSYVQTATRVDEVVAKLSAAAAEQARLAERGNSALNETSTSTSNVGRNAALAAERAQEIISGGQAAERVAESGLTAVQSAAEGIRGARSQMDTIAKTISALTERAATIGEIASTVSLLAERSNLLALNAAIESARAGAQGRGFSVVAQELRNLADASSRSASQVKQIIVEIQGSITQAVSEVREGHERGTRAEELAANAAESIRTFTEVTRRLLQLSNENALAAREQTDAADQMLGVIANLVEVEQLQMQSTNEIDRTAQTLRELSSALLPPDAARAGRSGNGDGSS